MKKGPHRLEPKRDIQPSNAVRGYRTAQVCGSYATHATGSAIPLSEIEPHGARQRAVTAQN
jgi:hypothetical protein